MGSDKYMINKNAWKNISNSIKKNSYDSIDHYNMGRLRGSVDTVEEIFLLVRETINSCGIPQKHKQILLDRLFLTHKRYYKDKRYVISSDDFKKLDDIYDFERIL